MPRDSRGGARNGEAGASYPNRTDLNGAPKALPITAAPGQPYGEAGAQKASQAITPMASAPLPTAPVAPNTPPPLAGSAPGSLPDPFGPTNRPNEHFMTGVDAGPGQGSSALAPNPFSAANPANSILAVLNTVQNPSSQVAFTKNYLAMQAENAAPH